MYPTKTKCTKVYDTFERFNHRHFWNVATREENRRESSSTYTSVAITKEYFCLLTRFAVFIRHRNKRVFLLFNVIDIYFNFIVHSFVRWDWRQSVLISVIHSHNT